MDTLLSPRAVVRGVDTLLPGKTRIGRRPLPRVLYALALVPGQKYGSLEEQIVFLAHAFEREDGLFLPLFICAPDEGNVTPFVERGVAAECLDLRRFSFGALRALRGLVRREEIDAIHWNFVAPLTNPYIWSLTTLTPQVRHLFTDHNSRLLPLPKPPGGWRRRVKSLLFRRYAQVWGVSQYIHDQLAAQVPSSRLICCPHFINTDRFAPDPQARPVHRAHFDARDAFVILAVANLIPEKGIDILIRAMTKLPERAVLWVAGAGPQRDNLQALAQELHLGQRVRLLGLQGHVEPLMQAADCFVCPSVWAEAAGLVNIEAQASGLPIVASAIGGIPEYLDAGRSGFLFEPGNADHLAERLGTLIDNPDLCRAMGEAARAFAVAHFSPARRMPAILDLYRRLKG